MGTLRGAADGQTPAPPRGRRGVTGFAILAAIAIAGTVGVVRWWHRPAVAAGVAAQGAPSIPVPSDTIATAATAATVGTIPPATTGAPILDPPAEAAAVPTPTASVSPSKPPAVAVAHPVHPASGAGHPPDAASARPAASVPQDMLYNPYR
jgi:hypothetical protein